MPVLLAALTTFNHAGAGPKAGASESGGIHIPCANRIGMLLSIVYASAQSEEWRLAGFIDKNPDRTIRVLIECLVQW